MIYLSGVSNPSLRAIARDRGIGLLVQPGNSYHLQIGTFPTWAIDNGCFSKGAAFDLPGYLAYLSELPAGSLFATAPDVVGDARATFARSLPVLSEIRDRGIPAAFVGQDGLEELEVPWAAFDAFFVGGSTEWKLSPAAGALVAEAKRRGKWVHMGRVNSARRFRYASSIGCDSADGTFLAFGPTANLPRLLSWLDEEEDRAATIRRAA